GERRRLASEVLRRVPATGSSVRRLSFDTGLVSAWDTGLLTFLRNLFDEAKRAHLEIDRAGLPGEVGRLLALANAVPMRDVTAPEPIGRRHGRVVSWILAFCAATVEVLAFCGEVCAAVAVLFTRRVRLRGVQFALLLEEVGVSGLPIMTLIGTLMGIILAFGAAIQLRQLGVQIFVADLVGISVSQEVGALITA